MHDDNRPLKQVFVSGVSSEFQSSRLLVRDDLLTGSIRPVLQDHFAPEASKTVEQMLRQKIEPCVSVIAAAKANRFIGIGSDLAQQATEGLENVGELPDQGREIIDKM